MGIAKNRTIGSFVAENYRTAAVFGKYGIDYCCNGNRLLEEVCRLDDVNEYEILQELQNIISENPDTGNDFNKWSPDLLADYIEKKHHRYIEQVIPRIIELLEKVTATHGENHPEVCEIAQHFRQSAGELTQHMKKEELVLFPVIRKMTEAEIYNQKLLAPQFGTVKNPIRMMMQDHSNEGERFRKIAALSNNYTPPADTCNTYRVTYAMLRDFEADLHLHIHLENNILFPKSVILEENLSIQQAGSDFNL